MISVIVPTIRGREHWLEKAERSFCEHTPQPMESIVLNDFATCGQAWNVGMVQAGGDYILLAADDLEAHEGWFEAGVPYVDDGVLPCPRILNSDGSLQSCGSDQNEHETGTGSDVARVPFFSRTMMEKLYPVFENQYAGDYWITREALKHGWPTVVVREMIFTHHLAMEGRLDTLASDWATFQYDRGRS